MEEHTVYEATYEDGTADLFCEAITRHFGSMCCVSTKNDVFISCVKPLLVDPVEAGMEAVGTLEL